MTAAARPMQADRAARARAAASAHAAPYAYYPAIPGAAPPAI